MNWIAPCDNYQITAKYHDPAYLKTIGRQHEGIDFINTQLANCPVKAVVSGKVVYCINNWQSLPVKTQDMLTGGNMVWIQTDEPNQPVYRQLHFSSISIAQGQTVTQGQVIGIMGKTGTTDGGVHCHVALNYGGMAGAANTVDPTPLFNSTQQNMKHEDVSQSQAVSLKQQRSDLAAVTDIPKWWNDYGLIEGGYRLGVLGLEKEKEDWENGKIILIDLATTYPNFWTADPFWVAQVKNAQNDLNNQLGPLKEQIVKVTQENETLTTTVNELTTKLNSLSNYDELSQKLSDEIDLNKQLQDKLAAQSSSVQAPPPALVPQWDLILKSVTDLWNKIFRKK